MHIRWSVGRVRAFGNDYAHTRRQSFADASKVRSASGEDFWSVDGFVRGGYVYELRRLYDGTNSHQRGAMANSRRGRLAENDLHLRSGTVP